MAHNGTVAISANRSKFWIFLYFNAPSLVFGQVPMKIIHFVQGDIIDELFHKLDRKKMPAAIQHEATITKAWSVLNRYIRNSQLCRRCYRQQLDQGLYPI